MNKNLLPLNLQLFADPPADGNKGADTPQTFDDLLKNKDYQSEFDRRVTKALETAKAKWQTEQDAAVEAAKTEAERLAKMNADQKAQHEREKREKDLADREAALTLRELKAQAATTLAEKGLPAGLIDTLNYTDADACQQQFIQRRCAAPDCRQSPSAGVGTLSNHGKRCTNHGKRCS